MFGSDYQLHSLAACPAKNSGNTGSGKKAATAAENGAKWTASAETKIKA